MIQLFSAVSEPVAEHHQTQAEAKQPGKNRIGSIIIPVAASYR